MDNGSSVTPEHRRHEILAGLKLGIGPGLGLFPLGIALGLLAIQSGLPAWAVPGLSIIGYAGSLEFLMIDMMTAATGLLTIAVTTFFVNFRHVFYAFSFPLHVIKNPIAKFYSSDRLDSCKAVIAADLDALLLGCRRTRGYCDLFGHSWHNRRTRFRPASALYHADLRCRTKPRTTPLATHRHRCLLRSAVDHSGSNHLCGHDHLYGVIGHPILHRTEKGWTL